MPSVPSYLQAYLQPGGGGLGTSGGVQYNTYRTPSNQIFTPDGKALTPGATPSDLPNYGIEDRGRPGSPLLNQDYAGMNYHERQKQYWIDQFGSDEGWNQFGGGQFDNRQDRRDARTNFYQNQWDARMGGGAPPPMPDPRRPGGRVSPDQGNQNLLAGQQNQLLNDPTAQNFDGLQGDVLMNALQGLQDPAAQPGQGGKGGGAGMPGGFQPYRGQQPRIAQYGQEGSGKSGGQGLPKQPAGQMQF